jgi:hypothetical protein
VYSGDPTVVTIVPPDSTLDVWSSECLDFVRDFFELGVRASTHTEVTLRNKQQRNRNGIVSSDELPRWTCINGWMESIERVTGPIEDNRGAGGSV